MSRYLVYLSGPISGLTYDDAEDWRKRATLYLERTSKIECLDPLRCKDFLKQRGVIGDTPEEFPAIGSDEFIGMRDHWDTVRSDVVLVNLLGAKTVSIGTVLEIGMAKAAGCKIVVVMEDSDNLHEHPMIRNYTDLRCSNLQTACETIKALLSV
jgi:nucleoside 2-deoxyribosyltransferase